MNPRFSPDPERPGFVVVDPVQNRQFPVSTDRAVRLDGCDTDRFRFPVRSARSFVARRLTFPYVVAVVVRDAGGEMLAEVTHDDEAAFGPGEYVLEAYAPIKLFLRVVGPLEVSAVERETVIRLAEPSRIEFGARSHHERPAGTITVPESVDGLRRALPYLASALKDTGPERSFPTLRGHPPLVEFGEEFAVPDGIQAPETGVTVEVPPETDHLLQIAPLVYYLGADVVTGPVPRITTDLGFSHVLDGESLFESVKRVLEQVFTLDCVVRTEGLYPVDLHEREVLEERLDWDFADLYGRSLAAQLETYLSVPYEAVADQTPTWPLVANCRPILRRAEMLPFVLNDLGLIRTVTFEPVRHRPGLHEEIDSFVRGPDDPDPLTDDDFVEVPPADAMEQVWMGDRWPLNAGKFVRAGFENKLRLAEETDDAEPRPVRVVVVCNDEAMRAEYEDEQLYGDRDELPFEVETHLDTTTEELREILGRRSDFLHYIGHIEGSRFVCSDGELDVHDVERVGARAFLLNGCKSLLQGPRMLEAGSVAGIVTLRDVGNRGAVEVGQQVARLLNLGHGIGSALTLVQHHFPFGRQYLAVGDVSNETIQLEDGSASYYYVQSDSEGKYRVTYYLVPDAGYGFGTISSPRLIMGNKYFIASRMVPEHTLITHSELSTLIDESTVAVLVDDELRWSRADD